MAPKSGAQKNRNTSIQHTILSALTIPIVIGMWIAASNGQSLGGKGWLLLVMGTFGSPAWLFFSVRNLIKPEKSKTISKVAAKGPTATAEVDAILNGTIPSQKTGDLRVTSDWIVFHSGETLTALRTSDVIWMYGLEIKHTASGIPVGTGYAIRIHDRGGESIDHAINRKDQEQTLASFANLCPRSLVGFHEGLSKQFFKDRPHTVVLMDKFVAEGQRSANALNAAA
jgi:hypothetical protein